jgi:hypothetical protein
MVKGKIKKQKPGGCNGKKRSIQKASSQERLSKEGSEKEKAIYKKISRTCYFGCSFTWTPGR